MSKCDKGVHKFEPRYNEKPVDGDISGHNIPRDRLFYKIYIHDVCVRCGKTTIKKKAI